MKQLFSIFMLTFWLMSCSNRQTESSLSAKAFAEKIKEFPEAPIIDVRTPEEFSSGHLKSALNYNWNDSRFEQQIRTLDKSKPVFVYCLSGGRSSAAATKMRANGFIEVYELEGGVMQWRNENLPLTKGQQAVSQKAGMTKETFNSLIDPDKIVLVDFYADWCVPCKKMEPYLNEISSESGNSVIIIRINTEENQNLCKELGITTIPVIQVYRNKKVTWTNKGFIEKEAILKQLQ